MTLTLENGSIPKRMGMVFTYGPMEIGMRVSGESVSNMVVELTYFETVIPMLVSIRMVNHMAKGHTIGPMVHCTLVNLILVLKQVEGCGVRIRIVKHVISMRASITRIKSMDRVYSDGRVATCIKARTVMMRGTAMVR